MKQSNKEVKKFGALIWLLSAGGAFGQTSDMTLTAAFAKLRAKPALVFHAVGTEARGSQTHTIEVDSWSDIDPLVPRARLKMVSFYDSKFLYGWAGDGVQLYHYDPVRNEYSAAQYGSYNGKQPDHMGDSMLQSLVAMSKGPAILPARFLRDVYSGDSALYKSWMAGEVPEEISTDVTHTITYTSASRKLLFTLNPKSGELISIEYWTQSNDGMQPVSSYWSLTYNSLDAAPSNWDLSFSPPPGCRPVTLIHG